MKRLYVLVEGATEREFVAGMLAPHLRDRGVWAVPIVVRGTWQPADPTQRDGVARLRAELGGTAPEDVNDGRASAIPRLAERCPHFGAWVQVLEALGPASA